MDQATYMNECVGFPEPTVCCRQWNTCRAVQFVKSRPESHEMQKRMVMCTRVGHTPFRSTRINSQKVNTSGLTANYIVGTYIQQFFSGRLLMREICDHFQRWIAWGETAYGSMVEIGNEGHFAMPLENLGVLLDQFDQDQPAWWTARLRLCYQGLTAKPTTAHCHPDKAHGGELEPTAFTRSTLQSHFRGRHLFIRSNKKQQHTADARHDSHPASGGSQGCCEHWIGAGDDKRHPGTLGLQ